MQTLWLYLHFPHLQLDTLLQQVTDDNAAELAYVILDESSNQICQLDQIAYQAGIRLGMGLGTAAMLKGDIQVTPYQPKITQSVLHHIAQNLYLLTSDICFFSDQGLLLRINNMLNLYGNLTLYWQAIQYQLNSENVHFHYATGHSPLAAKILATTAWDDITDDMRIIQQAIQHIPLQHTELTPKIVDKLKRVGIDDIQGLLNIPLADIAKRFDSDVATYIARLTAQLPHPVRFFHPKSDFDHYMELLYDIENTQILEPPLKKLLYALEEFLKTRDLLTQTIHIRLCQRDKPSIELSIHSQQGEYLAKTWLRLTALKLENTTLSAPVFALSLSVENTYIRHPDKQDLFAGKQGALSRLQLISLLKTKLGDEAVLKPRLANDFRPEHMLEQYYSAVSSSIDMPLQAMRPSFLLATPQKLREKLSISYGPERIETGWWDNHSIIRDYFIAYNTLGQWYWVFKTPEGDWFIHGIFS